MGHRSDVYIKVVKGDEDKLLDVLGKTDFEAVKQGKDDDYTKYVIFNAKWYETDEDTKAIISFIEEDIKDSRGLIAMCEDSDIKKYGSTRHIGLSIVSQIYW